MSHVLQSSIVIRDLECLDAAVKAMGATLVRNVKKYNWFGRSVGDYALPEGVTVEQLGKCDHVIRLPGVNYEIGVCRNQKDNSFRLQFDFYGTHGQHDGQKLQKHFGDGLSKLQVAYNEAVILKTAKQRGFTVKKTVLPNGEIKLRCEPAGGPKNYSYQRVGA